MIDVLTNAFVVGLGFVYFPFGTSWFEIPKVLVAWAFLFFLTVRFWWRQSDWKSLRFTPTSLLLYGGFFALSAISLIFFHSATTFFGNAFRLQGVLTLWALMNFAMLQNAKNHPKYLGGFSLLALLFMTAISIFGRADGAGRAVGMIGEANSLGAYSLFVWPLAWEYPVTKKQRSILKAVILLSTLVLIFLSGSRSALFGFLVQMAVWMSILKFGRRVAGMLGGVLLLLGLSLPFFQPKQVFEYRPDIWQAAWHAGVQRPIVGWGVGNIEVALKTAAKDLPTAVQFQYVDSSHNILLDWWVQGGIVGLLLFCAALVFAVSGLIQQKNISLLLSFFGILAVLFFNPASISILVPFWWILGRGLAKKP